MLGRCHQLVKDHLVDVVENALEQLLRYRSWPVE
jgi:hypothetical protein